MRNIQIRIKKLSENAVIPSYAHTTDAGLDLTAITKEPDVCGIMSYGTGIAVEIPQGYVGLLFPRSSIYKKQMLLSNCVGVIDSGYRGEVKFKFRTTLRDTIGRSFLGRLKNLFFGKYGKELYTTNFFDEKLNYNIGDRIGQLIVIPYPKVEFIECEELSESDRGKGGYGSTGR